MPIEQQNLFVCCAGRKGTGKSTKAREIMERSRRVFCFDTQGEHRWIPDRFYDADKALMYLLETHCWHDFQGSYVSETDEDDGDVKEFNEVCRVVYQQGNMLFEVEEIATLGMSAGYAPGPIKRIVRTGRHRNIDFLYTTQRIAEVWIGLRAATDVFILFSHSDPNDLKAIAERCGPDIADKVNALRGHDFVMFDVNSRQEVDSIVLPETAMTLAPGRV